MTLIIKLEDDVNCYNVWLLMFKARVTPNGDATAFVHRSKNLTARCGVAAKTRLKYQICQLKRVHNVLTASLQRPHDICSVFIAPMTFLRRTRNCCSVFKARSQRSHGDRHDLQRSNTHIY